MKLLHIESSLFADQGVSTQLSREFIDGLRQQHPGLSIQHKSFASTPIPHLDAEYLGALMTPESERSADQQEKVRFSDQQIAEVQEADILVIGLPMYNFGVPSTLKAWFDHIARAGVTFRYTETGPEGLLKGKKAYVMAARGGLYQGTDLDTQTPFVKNFLAFIGITDVEFVYAEGLNMGDESKDKALSSAREQIDALVA
ncbi:FMN-dependent NADH-azoreductase [Pleionea sp. CnH1-48]|uniref:FMN-dependent NADH-azoreductase n=1 Tax=Pleionea sp. CnH1-48 TaxID=2954494 RepID=UPI002097B78F|nr:FMN-dependent NADH-azoreductase [Pleionea sp. CnH1-48]MCO7227065.1 FMN-dependent NADH-azoreductase [Pleionea sp. CnH1-48]